MQTTCCYVLSLSYNSSSTRCIHTAAYCAVSRERESRSTCCCCCCCCIIHRRLHLISSDCCCCCWTDDVVQTTFTDCCRRRSSICTARQRQMDHPWWDGLMANCFKKKRCNNTLCSSLVLSIGCFHHASKYI